MSSKDTIGGKKPPSNSVLNDQTPVPENLKVFYKDWSKELIKENFKTANTALGQILTLSTALLGGSIAFWNNLPIGKPFNFIVLAFLLVTVIISLVATTPSVGSFDPENPDDIKRHVLILFRYKYKRIKYARNTLIISILLMVIGIFSTIVNIDGIIIWISYYTNLICSNNKCQFLNFIP